MSFDAFTDPSDDKDSRRVVIYGDGVVASQGRIYGVPYELARDRRLGNRAELHVAARGARRGDSQRRQ